MARSPLTPARRARLEKLAAYLEGLPANYQHFDMRMYFYAPITADEVGYARENGGVASCGAVACAIGHGPAAGVLAPPRVLKNGVDWNAYAGLFVGHYRSIEYKWAFDGEWALHDESHYGAAARIRYLLAHGKPPPFELDEWDDPVITPELIALYAPYRIDAKVTES